MTYLNFKECEGDDEDLYGSLLVARSDDVTNGELICIDEGPNEGSCRWYDVPDPVTLLEYFDEEEDDTWEAFHVYGICKHVNADTPPPTIKPTPKPSIAPTPEPIIAPTPEPTPKPTTDDGPGFCYSARSTMAVRQKDTDHVVNKKLSDLRVGDEVMAYGM